ncbi:MAG: hypothetical protein QG657_1523 [Acidobacteriota bacterium]|nr:hypothetical protein [Acidobacteriota bacterium]
MEVKGRALKSIQKYVREKFGQEGFDRWLSAISTEAYMVYSQSIDANAWFPLKTMLIAPMANVAQLFYGWNLKDAAWDFGRYSADFGLKGPYRLLIKIGSPTFFVQKSSEFMSAYYRPSAIETTEYRDGFGVVRITKFPEIDKTIEYRIGGWIERALEINGCKDVKVEITKSLTTFDLYTELKITWSA